MSQILIDPADDMLNANVAPWWDTVLHIYNDDYLGIRAAASALPGHKLVLPRRNWSGKYLAECHYAVSRTRATRIVFHGSSDALLSLARYLAWKSPKLRLFGVYHGNVSQWNDSDERAAAAQFLRMDAEGLYTRSHILKPGADSLLQHPAPRLLVNCAPRGPVQRARRDRGIALLPAPDIWRKNVYANAAAAEISDSIRVIWHYADLSDCPYPLKKCRSMMYRSPASHRDALIACDLVLNVTLVDCHPMVDLEANAMGRLSLHAQYGLGVLEDHPADRLQTVEDPTDISQIQAGIDALLTMSPERASALTYDFAQSMTRESINRYAEFLDLE